MARPDAVLIAGPTASGKSALSLDLAARYDGEIVNTDSMQIYPVLKVLTARPDDADLALAPHHLYGTAPLHEPYSAGKWMEDARHTAMDIWARGKVPIFVGGTGLYFKALEGGLAHIPEIPEEIREQVRGDLETLGSRVLHEQLSQIDPVMAERLRPSDSHRVSRALEVVRATGRSLSEYQDDTGSASLLAGKTVERLVLLPERSILHERINRRSELMIENGAIDEVRQLMALELPADATVLKAIGVAQLRSFIDGEQSLNDSVFQLKSKTRQYAKRQYTWFRGQFSENWTIIQ